MKTMKIPCLLVLIFVAACNAFSTGAPLTACTNMIPGHSVASQTSTPPYTLTVSASSYTASSTLTLTITATSGGNFKGFFLQARAANSSNTVAYGEFFNAPAGAKTIACNDLANSAATHANSDQKTSISISWRAPSPVGNVQFFLTVVQQFTTLWTGIKSGIITGPGAPPVTTSMPINTLIETISTAGCGTTKGCYRTPAGCSGQNCQYIATYAESGNNVVFELLYRPSLNTGVNWWVALGISDDTKMGNDTVFACTRYDSKIYYKSFYNDRRTPKPLTSTRAGVSNVFVSYMEGAIQCRFTRAKVPSAVGNIDVPGAVKNLNNAHHFIFGFGNTLAGGNLNYHRITTPKVSPQVVNTAQIRIVNGVSSKTLVKAHAALMSIAWVWLAPLAVFSARYMRAYKTDCVGTAAWFQIHRSSMISVVILSIAGFILVWVHVQGWSTNAGNHAYTGTATVVLSLIQPIMALFRCHPGEDKRWIFNYAHRTVGLLAVGLGLGTVFLGMDLYLLDLPSFTTWMTVGYLCGLGLSVIIIEIGRYHKRNVATPSNDDIQMQEKGDDKTDNPDVAAQNLPKKESGEIYTYAIETVVALATTAAIIAGLIIYPF
ncbi:Ferric-chelate reductase 1 [Trichoplax sp. H2]|nr:Ferric-chelate reductase 1 [Trichoplax sp. H2]|eukprot:RDD38018.1 Ferric-chelate reductase 1 [Trichoplax sp. H2]